MLKEILVFVSVFVCRKRFKNVLFFYRILQKIQKTFDFYGWTQYNGIEFIRVGINNNI